MSVNAQALFVMLLMEDRMKKINIKRQGALLYLYEAVISFRMVDAVWVIFLLGRGYSLVQVGIAEGVFHITSMLFEIPTGMIADLFGRKRTMVLAGIAGMCSGIFMGLDQWQGFIYCGMMFSAMSYNLASGTQEALMYDSLVSVGQEKDYRRMRSYISILGRVARSLACALSPVAIAIGYRGTYAVSAALCLSAALFMVGVQEPVVTEEQRRRSQYHLGELGMRMKNHIRTTLEFMREHPRTMCKLFADASVACPCYLILMYLQEHLVNCGWKESLIGIPVLFISLAGAAGAALASKNKMSVRRSVILCAVLGGIGTCLAGSSGLLLILFGSCAAQLCEGFCEVMVSENVNRTFTSDQRATLISVDSMLYSVLMVVASPLTGFLGSRFGVAVIFYVLGGLLIAGTFVMYAVLGRAGIKDKK